MRIVVYASSDEGVFPNVNFGFVKGNVAWIVGIYSHTHGLYDLGSHGCVKEGKLCGKGFLASICCSNFNS